MNSFDLHLELQTLANRFAHLGVTTDLACLTSAEAYALLLWLRRLAGC